MEGFRRQFIEFAVASGVIRFGEFKTKAGRLSPYFFNAGLFNDGASVARLAEFYGETIAAAGLHYDMLFGPAYKGIPLVTACAMKLAERGLPARFAFNRKEAKDHGEGGGTVGAPLAGRVVIVDDVISAGTSVRESVAVIRAAQAEPCGVVIALDRQERGQEALSAVQEVERCYGIPVYAVARLEHLLLFLEGQADQAQNVAAIRAYRDRYGVNS
jgi:orotate phosphoribosyltransferase